MHNPSVTFALDPRDERANDPRFQPRPGDGEAMQLTREQAKHRLIGIYNDRIVRGAYPNTAEFLRVSGAVRDPTSFDVGRVVVDAAPPVSTPPCGSIATVARRFTLSGQRSRARSRVDG